MPDPPSWGASLLRSLARLAVVVACASAVYLALDWAMEMLAPSDGSMPWAQMGLLAFVFVVYIVVLAIPFMPGVEIGITLLVLRGPDLVVPVYIATVLGLLLAFFIGRHMPYRVLKSIALDLRLRRIYRLIAQIEPLSQAQRLVLLRRWLPDWLGTAPLTYRYVLLAVLINLPGSAVIGGGGGILLMAGLSRLFVPRALIATVVLAVAPVPFLVWMFGLSIFQS